MPFDAWLQGRAAEAPLGAGASRVVEVLTSQPRFASYASARQVADQAAVNISTVTRTAQSLGFAGWPELQLEIRDRYLGELTAAEVLSDHGNTGDPVVAAFRSDMTSLALAAHMVDVEEVRAVAEAMIGARRTLVIASGSYLAPAVMLAHIGGLSGIDVDYDAVGGTHRASLITRMGPDDCLVVFNVWRLPRDVYRATCYARDRRLTVCVITDRRSSPLAEVADHVVIVPSEGVAHFPSLTPAMALMHAILSQIVAVNADSVRTALASHEDSWRQLDLMEDLPDRP